MTVKVDVELDIISIAEIDCTNFECSYNLINDITYGTSCCRLKVVRIGDDGKCRDSNNKYKRKSRAIEALNA